MTVEERQAYWKDYSDNNREKIRESQRRYRQKHREEINASMRAWRHKNPEHFQSYVKDYREKNGDHIRAYHRKYYAENVIGIKVECANCGHYAVCFMVQARKEHGIPNEVCEQWIRGRK